MRLELTIDDLVLDGFDPRDRTRIADAIQRELSAVRLPGRGAQSAHRIPNHDSKVREGSPGAIARAVRRSVVAALAEQTIR